MRLDSNMNASEIMQSYCVRVNKGSGVLVNAMTLDYSYVLTASHVVKNINVHIVTDHLGKKINVLAVLTHPTAQDLGDGTYDFAILKVEYQENVAQRYIPASSLLLRKDLVLAGFPKTETESSNPIKFYDGHLTSVVNELVTFTIDGIPAKSTIEGMSGGGIYHVQGHVPYLIGIEFEMDRTPASEQFGRVKCHSLVKFKEIIEAYASAPMIPAYLECFSRMRERIFEFNVYDPNNVLHLKNALEQFADSLINQGMPSPYQIMEKYDSQLLVDPLQLSELESRELWVAYLEFLVISALLDNVPITDNTYLISIERKRRLLYSSDGTNWIRRLEDLLKTARRLLDKDGTLIVASPEPAASMLPPDFQLKKVISNIAIVPNQGPLAPIDNVESSIYGSFKLTHLEGLRKHCVIDSETEYKAKQAGQEQLRLFRDKLDAIIK